MKKYKVTLTKEEREELQELTSKGSPKAQKVLNCLILLNCDDGPFQEHRATNEVVSQVLHLSMKKIDRVKKRFVEEGLELALNGRRGERVYERKADGDCEARLVALSCTKPPVGYARWSLRLLADQAVELGFVESISYETVRRVLKKTNSNPGSGKAG
jgi:transposase